MQSCNFADIKTVSLKRTFHETYIYYHLPGQFLYHHIYSHYKQMISSNGSVMFLVLGGTYHLSEN